MLPTHSVRRTLPKKRDEKNEGLRSLSSSSSSAVSSTLLKRGSLLSLFLCLIAVVFLVIVFREEPPVIDAASDISQIKINDVKGTSHGSEDLLRVLTDAHNALNEKTRQLSDSTFQLTLAQSSLKEKATEVLSLKIQLSKAQEESLEAMKKLEEMRAQEKLVESEKQQLEKKLKELQDRTKSDAMSSASSTMKTRDYRGLQGVEEDEQEEERKERNAQAEQQKTPTKSDDGPVRQNLEIDNTLPQIDDKDHIATHHHLSDLKAEERRQFVKQAMKFAWDNYKIFAWGDDELRPISKSGKNWFNLGLTIVDSIDTLFIMDLVDEYQLARDWIEHELDFDKAPRESLFELTIRNLGGLLSIYELTKDKMFLDRAEELGEKLLGAFDTSSGLPDARIHMKGTSMVTDKEKYSLLAEIGSLQLEFLYLAYHTKNSIFAEKPLSVFKKLRDLKPEDGLYPVHIDSRTGVFEGDHLTIGANGDSFYEYQLKLWLLTNKQYDGYRSMYEESSNGIINKLVRSTNSGHLFVEDLRNGNSQNRMEHLSCFAGGMFGLGSTEGAVPNPEEQMGVGANLTETCFSSYKATKTGLGPEMFSFDQSGTIVPQVENEFYALRPETIESLFVMWRLTHDQKYRDWGWQIFEAIETHCRTPTGYSGVKNVEKIPVEHDDLQQSFFLAETLKYLYLLFSPDDLLPLSDFVFNTEAHPLGIIRETSNTMPRDIHQHLMLF